MIIHGTAGNRSQRIWEMTSALIGGLSTTSGSTRKLATDVLLTVLLILIPCVPCTRFGRRRWLKTVLHIQMALIRLQLVERTMEKLLQITVVLFFGVYVGALDVRIMWTLLIDIHTRINVISDLCIGSLWELGSHHSRQASLSAARRFIWQCHHHLKAYAP